MSEILGTHVIRVVAQTSEGVIARNSWGGDWGIHSHCIIPTDVVKQFFVEAWGDTTGGVFPVLQFNVGLSCLSWKTRSWFDSPEVYGEEVIDASTGERLAWAFATQNLRGELVVEEFFVWPDYRGNGYARILANRLKLLSKITGRSLVMMVPWADCETHKLSGVIKVSEMLELVLSKSDTPVAGLFGRKKVLSVCVYNEQSESPDGLGVVVDRTGIQRLAAQLDVPPRPECPRDELLPRFVPVWFATNREKLDTWNPATRFGNSVSESITFGRCDVTIPRWHCFGKVQHNLWQKWLSRFSVGDKSIHEVNYPLQFFNETSFWTSVKESFIKASGEGCQHDGLIFLHGYNVSFDVAAIYAGQLAFDLKIPNTAFFSWPSQGNLRGYFQDEETIRSSEEAILDFIIAFSNNCPNGKVHIIAHSMGNRGLLSAFYINVAQKAMVLRNDKIGQVFLAAPDVNTNEFKKHVGALVGFAERVTLYTARQDVALWVSQGFHNYQRAGSAPPFTIVDGVDTIHVPFVDCREDGFRHSYFSKMAPVLYDIDALIKSDSPPSNRLRLQQVMDNHQSYWEFTQ